MNKFSKAWEDRLDLKLESYETIVKRDFDDLLQNNKAMLSELNYLKKKGRRTTQEIQPVLDVVERQLDYYQFNNLDQSEHFVKELIDSGYVNLIGCPKQVDLLLIQSEVLGGLIDQLSECPKQLISNKAKIIVKDISTIGNDSVSISTFPILTLIEPSPELYFQDQIITIDSLGSQFIYIENMITGKKLNLHFEE